MLGDWIARGSSPLESLPGLLIMLGAVLVGVLLNRATGKKIPAVCWVSLVAMALTSPLCPWAAQVGIERTIVRFGRHSVRRGVLPGRRVVGEAAMQEDDPEWMSLLATVKRHGKRWRAPERASAQWMRPPFRSQARP